MIDPCQQSKDVILLQKYEECLSLLSHCKNYIENSLINRVWRKDTQERQILHWNSLAVDLLPPFVLSLSRAHLRRLELDVGRRDER